MRVKPHPSPANHAGGVVRPVVGAALPLAEARKAHEWMAGPSHPRGKIVLEVARATPS